MMIILRWIKNFLKKFFPKLFEKLEKFLLGFLGAFIAPIISFIQKIFSKLPLILAVISFIGATIIVFYQFINMLFVGVQSSVPGDVVAVGRMFLPGNIPLCISVLLAARLKSLIFYWLIRISEKFENA